ncbi:MAG TPA: hypothetical protein VMT50_01285, partial [Steroidobacteraceae bacterium]|nr:hypothetical protein [Steroidobacteraceae bacterium]
MTLLKARPRRTLLICLVTLATGLLAACGGGGGGGGGGISTYSISGTVSGAGTGSVVVQLTGAKSTSTTT